PVRRMCKSGIGRRPNCAPTCSDSNSASGPVLRRVRRAWPKARDFGTCVDPVTDLMLNTLGWFQGCLYNQEIDEYPQLYFEHMLKSGDAYQLAQEIRQGLDLTNSR